MSSGPAGARRAYETVFKGLAPRLHRMAYLFLHNAHAAEDAVQETCVRGLAAFEDFRGDARPETWLYSIALNVCRQKLREADGREGLASFETLDGGRLPGRSARGPVTSLMRRETAARLALALGFLTDLQRESFVLHYVEELPYEAVAPMLGVSAVAARGLAHRARKVLLAKLPAGLDPSFGASPRPSSRPASGGCG